MRRLIWIALVLVGAGPAACSSDDDRPAAAGTSGGGAGKLHDAAGMTGSSESGGDSQVASGAQQGLGGAGLGGEDPFGHLGGLGPVNSAGGGAPVAALCDVTTTWGNPQSLAGIGGDGNDLLLAMTHDELTIVFRTEAGLWVADRSSAAADFGAPVAQALPAAYTELSGVGLSADGLRMVIVNSAGLGEVTRSSRQGAFGTTPSTVRFDALNYDANQFGAYLIWPVLAKDDQSLYFVRQTGDESVVYHAVGDAIFAVPEMSEDMVTLGGTGGDLKLTVSVSADERTIFIFDEALDQVSGLWSSAPGAPFTELAQFPGLHSVFTNDDCTRLYGTLEVEGGFDIVLLTPN
ncbi:MAG TPA: hypothetical protein VJN18_27945 [Polyangiaceae bacterium]|nr:hypothetical protein [Polyangiaceae bacterium]